MIVVLKVAQVLLETLLHRITGQALLVCPLLVVVLVTQFIATLAATDLTSFVIAWVIIFAMMLIEKVHGDGIKRGVVSATTAVFRFIKGLFIDTDEEDERLAILRQKKAESATAVPMNPLGYDDDSLESLMRSFSLYASSTVSIWMAALSVAMLIVFRDELPIAKMYRIREAAAPFYLLFFLFAIVAWSTTDIFTLNVQELFRSWHVYDYLSYCTYRFKYRTDRWQATSPQMDLGIRKHFRSLDHVSFSSQLYFMLSVHAAGFLLSLFSIEALVQSRFNPLGDPLTWGGIVLPILLLCELVKIVLIEISDFIGIWKLATRRER